LRKKLIPTAMAGAGAAVLVAATALPAGAAGTGDTTAVIQLSGGTLDISVPAGPVALASGAVTETSVSGQLGTVTVTDTRAADPASWTASVSATPFQNGSHSLGTETYDTGVVTSTGIPISQFTITSPVTLSTTPQAVVALNPTSSGNNSASWNPTITVAIPAGTIAGAYSAVITHSVI
jgi:hypothetical protein